MKKQIKTLVLAAMALFFGTTANAQTFSINDLQGAQGTTIEIPVLMNNGEDLEVTSFNFDLFLPAGVTAVVDEYGDIVAELSARSQKHTLESKITDEGARFVSYSGQNRSYKGSEGEILTVSVKLDAAPGIYTLRIGNATMTKSGTFDVIDCPETTANLTIETATVINGATIANGHEVQIYNVQGQRVSDNYNGIMVTNGKKILRK